MNNSRSGNDENAINEEGNDDDDDDLKGDLYQVRNSAKKNKINIMEKGFESGFRSGHQRVTLQADPIVTVGPENVQTLKLNLLKLQPVP
jgi:hypothetical protein